MNKAQCSFGKLLIQLVINEREHIKMLPPKRKYNSYMKGANLDYLAVALCSPVWTEKTVALCVRFQVLTPAWTTMSTVLASVQRDSQVTLAFSEASDNQWPRTMTPMEDYKDSLSLCRSAYCIDFLVPVIGLYFCDIECCYIFPPCCVPFSLSTVQLFSCARCQMQNILTRHYHCL